MENVTTSTMTLADSDLVEDAVAVYDAMVSMDNISQLIVTNDADNVATNNDGEIL